MKVKLTSNISFPGTSQQYYKGRTYNAVVATNQPGYARKTSKGIKINKVFIQKKGEQPSPVIDSDHFEIVEFAEQAEFEAQYAKRNEKAPRQKKSAPKGWEMRPGFRLLTQADFDDATDSLLCMMGTESGTCHKEAKYVKGDKVKTYCCARHGIQREGTTAHLAHF